MRHRTGQSDSHSRTPGPVRKGKSNAKRGFSGPFRAYVIATVLFVFALFAYYSFTGQPTPTGHQQWERRLASIHTTAIDTATRGFRASPTLPFMDTLVEVSANTSALFEARLDDLTAAEESRERGDTAGGDAPMATTSAKKSLARVAGSLQSAGDALYTLMEGMFLGTDDAALHEMPKGLPRTTFGLFASALHLHGVVLPEYYLVTDAEAAHARSLVRALNILDWAVEVPNARFFNWTSDPCRKALPGTTKKWVSFCQRSLASRAAARTRSAAVLEELIALQPEFAPFRLHYAVALTLMNVPRDAAHPTFSTHPASLQTIRSTKRAWTNYEQLNRATQQRASGTLSSEMALLSLLEAYALPLEQTDEAICEQTLAALSVLQSCEDLMNVVPRGARWPGEPFALERQPAMLHLAEAQKLLMKVELVVGDKFSGSFRETYASCMA